MSKSMCRVHTILLSDVCLTISCFLESLGLLVAASIVENPGWAEFWVQSVVIKEFPFKRSKPLGERLKTKHHKDEHSLFRFLPVVISLSLPCPLLCIDTHAHNTINPHGLFFLRTAPDGAVRAGEGEGP
jgi:hypothetical protein